VQSKSAGTLGLVFQIHQRDVPATYCILLLWEMLCIYLIPVLNKAYHVWYMNKNLDRPQYVDVGKEVHNMGFL